MHADLIEHIVGLISDESRTAYTELPGTIAITDQEWADKLIPIFREAAMTILLKRGKVPTIQWDPIDDLASRILKSDLIDVFLAISEDYANQKRVMPSGRTGDWPLTEKCTREFDFGREETYRGPRFD